MDTMTTSPDSDLRVGLIPIEAWQAAVEAFAAGTLSADADPDQQVGWRTSGLLPDGQLADDWRRALELASGAPAGLTVVARRGAIAFLTHAYSDGNEVATVSQRVKASLGSDEVTAVDPNAEVAVTSSAWGALRRVLPPLAELRAAPRDAGEARRITLPATSVPGHVLATPEAFTAALPSLPRELAAAVDPDVTVFAFGSNLAGSSDELIWYLTAGELFRYEPRRGALWAVTPGDVGAGLTRLLRSLSA